MGRTLPEHAAYELAKPGMTDHDDAEARKVATDVMALVRRFEKQDLAEKSARFVLEAFETLCNFLPLTPITTDPDEWEKYEIDRKNVDTGEVEKKLVWQSKRAPAIFSEDEGKTFIDQRTGKAGESVDHVEYAKQLEDQKKARAERKAKAGERGKPLPPTDSEVPAAEAGVEPPPAATTPKEEPKAEEAKDEQVSEKQSGTQKKTDTPPKA